MDEERIEENIVKLFYVEPKRGIWKTVIKERWTHLKCEYGENWKRIRNGRTEASKPETNNWSNGELEKKLVRVLFKQELRSWGIKLKEWLVRKEEDRESTFKFFVVLKK